MPHDYDILIAGAGPAGCAAAYDLAQAGQRVLLLDKRSFPRHKACACGLTRKTLAALRYSVAPVTERVCHEIILQPATPPGGPFMKTAPSSSWVGSQTDKGAHNDRSADVRVKTKTPICAMAVRSRFDAFCLEQTLASGRDGGTVTLRKIDAILALRQPPTHIELDIAFRTPEGTSQTETLTAPVLIGADGSNGQTRRLTSGVPGRPVSALPEGAGAFRPLNRPATKGALAPEDPAWYQRGFALEATVPFSTLHKKLSPSAQDDLIFDFAPLPGGYGWLFPKGDHINIGVGTFAPSSPDAHSPRQHSPSAQDVTRQLLLDYTHQKLGLTTPDLDQLHITGQYLGMGGHAYTPTGRVLLVGDAAGLVDPLTGEGIHSAIVSGQAAAAAIIEAFAFLSVIPAGNLLHPTATAIAHAYAKHLAPLQQTLAFSHRAAQAFYRQPERGFKAMRIPVLRNLILKTYADGIPHTRLLTALAKLV